jgi:hypothetical protein
MDAKADVTKPILAAPTCAPPSGAISAGTDVAVSATGLPTGGQIYYTTNGSVPACSGASCSGTLYIGAVQVSQPETINAIAHDPSGANQDSPPGSCVYTIIPQEAGTLGPVIFSPTSATENNDFLVALSDTPGATICFTLDGSTPTCNTATGACTGTAQTYTAGGGGVSINGTVTNLATGQVTITAIACEAGSTPSISGSQVYALTVADPTLVLNGNAVPSGTGIANVPWPAGTGGLTPTVNTATNNSIVVTDNVGIRFTTVAGQTPTCTTGTLLASPTTFGTGVAGAPVLNTNTTYEFIGCKQGYLPSGISTFPISIQENAPVLAKGGATNTYPYAFVLVETAAPDQIVPPLGTPGVVDAANKGGAGGAGPNNQLDWVCLNDNGAASCGALFQTCGAKNTMLAAGGVVTAPAPATNTVPATIAAPGVVTPNTTVNAVSCGVGVNASALSTVVYTLQYSNAFIWSNNAAFPGSNEGAPAPGWDFKGTSTPPGVVSPGMAIPNGATLPYTGFNVDTAGDVAGGACGAEFPTTASCVAAGNIAYQVPDYYCWALNATAACGNTAAGGGVFGNPLCAATATNPGGNAASGGVLNCSLPGPNPVHCPGGPNTPVGVNGGDKISVIACQNADFSVAGHGNTQNVAFLPSPATTMTFGAPGSATSPTQPAPANPYDQQAVVTITNNDTTAGGSYICADFKGGTPTCGQSTNAIPGACCNGGAGCGVGTPAVPDPGTWCWCKGTAAGGAACPGAIPAAGSAWIVATAANQAACSKTGQAGLPGNTATIPAGVIGPAGAVGDQSHAGLIQVNGEIVTVVACNASETPSAAVPATYQFTAQQPDLTTMNIGATIGNLDTGGTIGAGQGFFLSNISNFDSTGAATPMQIHYSWTGTATCGSPGIIGPAAIIPAVLPGVEPIAVWFTPPSPSTPGGGPNAAGEPAIVPSTAGAQTLSTIACGENSTIQASSAPRNVSFTVTSAVPLILTDQGTCTEAQHTAGLCPATSCWTGTTVCNNPPGTVVPCTAPGAVITDTLPLAGPGATVCPPVAAWDGNVTTLVTTQTPGATLCVSTTASIPATCASGTCGAGDIQIAGVPAVANATPAQCGGGGPCALVNVIVDGTSSGAGVGPYHVVSGSTVAATSCSGTLAAPAAGSTATFTLNSSPVVFTPALGAVACKTPVVVSQDISSLATLSAGGSTGSEVVCYTANGAAPTFNAACAPTGVNCPGATCATTCTPVNSAALSGTGQGGAPYATLTGGVAANFPIALTSSTPIKWATCIPGEGFFTGGAGETGSQSYTVSPYAHPITVDGNLSEWKAVLTDGAAPFAPNVPASADGEGVQTWNPGAGASNGQLGSWGFYTHDATNLYIGLAYCQTATGVFGARVACAAGAGGNTPPVGTTYAAFYIGANPGAGATGAIKDLPIFGGTININRNVSAQLGIGWAFQWQSTNGAAPGTFNWNGSTVAWAPNAPPNPAFPVTVGYDATFNTAEFSIPLTALGTPNPTNLTVFGTVVANIGSTNTNELFRFPGQAGQVEGGGGAGYTEVFNDNLLACTFPNWFTHFP